MELKPQPTHSGVYRENILHKTPLPCGGQGKISVNVIWERNNLKRERKRDKKEKGTRSKKEQEVKRNKKEKGTRKKKEQERKRNKKEKGRKKKDK
jgi:hypothetical protein